MIPEPAQSQHTEAGSSRRPAMMPMTTGIGTQQLGEFYL
jgi:hypothetical protein